MDLIHIVQPLLGTSAVLHTLLSNLDDATLSHKPDAESWCIKEIIGHLIASEGGAFRDRIASIVAGVPEIAAVSATEPVAARDDANTPLADLLKELDAERAKSAVFLRSLSPDDLTKTAPYPPHGTFSAGDFVYEWPFHDYDHIQQILGILKSQYLPYMSETMRTALS